MSTATGYPARLGPSVATTVAGFDLSSTAHSFTNYVPSPSPILKQGLTSKQPDDGLVPFQRQYHNG